MLSTLTNSPLIVSFLDALLEPTVVTPVTVSLFKLNLSEEGVRIDGRLLEINSETHFNDDLVMNAGLIRSADGAINIDLNAGVINLSRPLTINAVPVATEEYVEENLTDTIKNIEVGGRNLLRNSGVAVSNEDYNIARYDLTDDIKEDEEVTLTIWGSLATTKTNFRAYNSGGSVSVATLTDNGDGTLIKGSETTLTI